MLAANGRHAPVDHRHDPVIAGIVTLVEVASWRASP
jgi:hypothetical protein